MNIARFPENEAWLVTQTKAWLDAQPRRAGIHVSDILYPRKAYFKQVDPRPMTTAEAGYFIAGRGHHEVIQAIIKGSRHTAAPDEGSHEWQGIWYSPDVLTPHPLEIKTSRARYGPKSSTERSLLVEYETYLKQLSAYMAIREDPEGDLLVFYLALRTDEGEKTEPAFRWYHVKMTSEELGQRQAEILATKKALLAAFKRKSPTALPPCPEWMCRGCVWAPKCGCGKPAQRKRRLTL